MPQSLFNKVTGLKLDLSFKKSQTHVLTCEFCELSRYTLIQHLQATGSAHILSIRSYSVNTREYVGLTKSYISGITELQKANKLQRHCSKESNELILVRNSHSLKKICYAVPPFLQLKAICNIS